jgi:hypothetical protein
MNNTELHTFWEKELREQQASGKSIRTWCKEHTLRENRFYYWRRKLQAAEMGNNQQVQWLPLGATKTTPGTAITVHLGQVIIEVPKNFDRHQLREIIQVLSTI